MEAGSPYLPATAAQSHFELENLWEMADQGPRAEGVMTFLEMNASKASRKW